ncbi:MAG: KEOPS complex subunit Cgi121 [Thermoplasmata archaeon]
MIAYVEGKIDRNVKDFFNKKIILISAEHIISELEVESAYLKAKRSFATGNNVSRELRSEIMLYLYGGRQISEAVKKYGINEKTNKYFLISEDDINILELGFKMLKFKEKYKREIILQRLENIALVDLKK